MNRYEEYQALLRELEPPKELENVLERAMSRKKASRKRWRVLGVPAGSFAACFLGFVLLVNCFPPFASACGGVPVLRELAKAVAWSPSLAAAVENEYVQPIGQSQTVGGITATMEYLIVDQKQVNLFYTLKGDYEDLSGRRVEFFPEQHCAVSYGSSPNPPGTLQQITMDYVEEHVPEGFSVTIGVESRDLREHEAPAHSVTEELLSPSEEAEPEILAEFTFDLTFDPTFTAAGERVSVQETVEFGGQCITVTEAEIYPTHIRIGTADHAENTAWLKGLSFYLENERGQRFEPISNGITATGGDGTNSHVSFRLESAYFADSRHLTLFITGAEWLDKDRETVRLDLKAQTAEFLPEGVELVSAEEHTDGWIVKFRAERRGENRTHQIFYTTFRDAEGKKYDMHGFSSYTDYEDASCETFIEELALPDYHGDEVWLCPTYTHTTQEQTPVRIPIK